MSFEDILENIKYSPQYKFYSLLLSQWRASTASCWHLGSQRRKQRSSASWSPCQSWWNFPQPSLQWEESYPDILSFKLRGGYLWNSVSKTSQSTSITFYMFALSCVVFAVLSANQSKCLNINVTPDKTFSDICILANLPGVGDWGPLGYLNQSSMDSLVESRRMCCSDATPATKVATTPRYALIFSTRFSNPRFWPPLLHGLGLKPAPCSLFPLTWWLAELIHHVSQNKCAISFLCWVTFLSLGWASSKKIWLLSCTTGGQGYPAEEW